MAKRDLAAHAASRRSGRAAALLVLLALVTAGCASVEAFHATPRNICPGESVTLSWRAKGDVRLVADPEISGTGKQASEGSGSFAPSQSTQFEIHAHRLLGDAQAEQYVWVAPARQGYGGQAHCAADARSIELALELEEQVGPGFRVTTVHNPLERRVEVGKDGNVAQLDARGQSDALRGVETRGSWFLRSPLGADEDCDDALRSVRQRLRVEIGLGCGG